MPISGISPDQAWSEVDLWLAVDVFVAHFCDGSDAPLHVVSVEFELCFGDVGVELLDGLGIVCALLVGDFLAGEVRRALVFCLMLRDVLAPFDILLPSCYSARQSGRTFFTRYIPMRASKNTSGW